MFNRRLIGTRFLRTLVSQFSGQRLTRYWLRAIRYRGSSSTAPYRLLNWRRRSQVPDWEPAIRPPPLLFISRLLTVTQAAATTPEPSTGLLTGESIAAVALLRL